MSKNFDLIANVSIDIVSPIVDDTSFDNILILGPLPKVALEKAPPKVGVYSRLDEVEEAGWVATGDNADPVGVAARIAFSQKVKPSKVYIAAMQKPETQYEDDEGNQVTEPVQESAVETLKRAVGTSGWYVACPAGVEPSEYDEIAEYIETQEKMFLYTDIDYLSSDESSGNGEFSSYVDEIFYRSMGIYGKEESGQATEDIPEANYYLHIAHAVEWLRHPSGSETTAFKQLTAVYPSKLTSTEMGNLDKGNINYFITVGNKNVTMNGKVRAGEWADIIRFRDWLKHDMQLRVVNLFITNPKIPYTDSGIGLVQNQMELSLKSGQTAGGVAEDEFDEDGNKIPGYVTSVPLASSLTSSEKASRKLKNCKFKARLAGAIHFADLTGSLTYEL